MTENPRPHLPPGERLRRVGIAAWAAIGVLLLAYLLVQGIVRIKVILPPLFLALLIIYMLNPVITRFERRGVRRGIGVAASYIIILGTFTLIVIAISPLVSQQIEEFADDWPEFREDIVSSIEDGAAALDRRFGLEVNVDRFECLLGAAEEEDVAGTPTEAKCDEVTEQFRESLVSQAGRLTSIGGNVLEVLLVLILGPLLALYLLIDLPQIQRDLLHLVPAQHQSEVRDVAGKVGRAVGGFFRGQLLVALIVGAMSALGFRLIGLDFWLVIGAVAGFFNLVPLIGPYIGGAVGFAVGLVTGGLGLGLRAALVELVVQQIDNHVISPNVMKRTVNLHPVTVMLSLLAGGAVAGFWGVLLGVPVVAVTKIVAGHLWATRVLREPVSPFVVTKAPRPPGDPPEPTLPPGTSPPEGAA